MREYSVDGNGVFMCYSILILISTSQLSRTFWFIEIIEVTCKMNRVYKVWFDKKKRLKLKMYGWVYINYCFAENYIVTVAM